MEAFKEDLEMHGAPFPMEVFIVDGGEGDIVSNPHWHDCCEILYILEGTANQQVNDQFFRVGRNDVIILNQGDIHGTYCRREEGTQILVIKFLSEILDSSYSRVFESQYILAFLNNQEHKVYHVPDVSTNSADIYQIMMGLYNEYLKRETGYEIFIKGYIYQLIACFVRRGIIKIYDPYISGRDVPVLNKLLNHIERNYRDRIDLEEASGMLNMSYSYLSRYFKKVTGRNFKEYLDFVRVCEAEKLFLTKGVNISQAAYEVGFSNVSSFNRVFKRVRGYTPGDIKRTKTAKK